MRFDYVRSLREVELKDVKEVLPRGGRILEIGAGAGWQAAQLAMSGFDVVAVDVQDSKYKLQRVWPVTEFDGYKLPYADESFDAIFSSNVLEHIEDLQLAMGEHARVLKRGGRAVHVVPSGAWRFWSLVGHYPAGARYVFCRVACKQDSAGTDRDTPMWEKQRPLWKRALLAERHGEIGSAIGEMSLFTRRTWRTRFEQAGWSVIAERRGGIFCTGHALLAERFSIQARRRIAWLLGSACHLFVLEKQGSEISSG